LREGNRKKEKRRENVLLFLAGPYQMWRQISTWVLVVVFCLESIVQLNCYRKPMLQVPIYRSVSCEFRQKCSVPPSLTDWKKRKETIACLHLKIQSNSTYQTRTNSSVIRWSEKHIHTTTNKQTNNRVTSQSNGFSFCSFAHVILDNHSFSHYEKT
jgi:hypothetical protein